MKKRVMFAGLAMVLASFVMTSCATTTTASSNIKGKAPKVKTAKRVIVDYQGATLGKAVPEWVELLVEGQYSQQVLQKVMPGLEKKKVFVAIGKGDNLDFVKQWTDLVDIETEVTGTMERVAAKAVQAQMTGSASATGKQADPSEIQKSIDMYKASLTNVRIAGLEKVASYWTETQVIDKKDVVDDYFEYYSVWAIDEKLFEQQLKEAMKSIDETTTESKALKNMVSQKIMQSLAVSNDASVTDEADGIIIVED